jgi:hypothetical protein
VRHGLHAQASSVSPKAQSDGLLQRHTAIHESHAGGAKKKPDYTLEKKAATALVGDLNAAVDARLLDKAPTLHAIKSAVTPHVANLVDGMAQKIAQNPAAMAQLHKTLGAVGTREFSNLARQSVPHLVDGFTASTGCALMNADAVSKALSTASKLSPKTAAMCAKVSSKLGVDAAKTSGKALPLVGNAIAVGSTLFAGAHFIGQIFQRPVHGEKIWAAGVHTLSQAVGIAFPWVALGGDLVQVGWSARLAHKDAAKAAAGDVVTPDARASLQHALPFLAEGSDALALALKGAGLTSHADTVAALGTKARTLQGMSDVSSADLIALKRDQQNALQALAEATQTGLADTLHDVERPADKAALMHMSEATGSLIASLKKMRSLDKAQEMPGADADATAHKRHEQAAELLSALSPLAHAGASYVLATHAEA